MSSLVNKKTEWKMNLAFGWIAVIAALVLIFACFEPIIFIIIGVIAALILLIKGIILLAGLITWWGVIGIIISPLVIDLIWRFIYFSFIYRGDFDTHG